MNTIKKVASWVIPNAAIMGSYLVYKICSDEQILNVLFFITWFFVVIGFLCAFLCDDKPFRKSNNSPIPMWLKTSLPVIYTVTFAYEGWLWTAGFYAAAELLVLGKLMSIEKSMKGER